MNDQNQSYKLTPEHISNLYNQEYLRDAIKCEKFKSLDGALQRAVIEEALIETEAMKLSTTYGEEARQKEAFYFSKYTEYYSYQAAADPKRFRDKDSRFLSTNVMKRERDSARALAITERARTIDMPHNIVRMKVIEASRQQ